MSVYDERTAPFAILPASSTRRSRCQRPPGVILAISSRVLAYIPWRGAQASAFPWRRRESAVGSVGDVRRVDQGRVVDRQRLLASYPRGASSWRGSRREADVLQDFAGGLRIFDQGDEAHRAVAAPTHQHVHRPGSLHQLCPIEAPSARWVVGVVRLGWPGAETVGRRQKPEEEPRNSNRLSRLISQPKSDPEGAGPRHGSSAPDPKGS
jgi:hypothetical protein